jgi:hypothetical protein
MMKKALFLLVLSAMIAGTWSCKNKPEEKNKEGNKEKATKTEAKPSVCIWNNGSIRAKPKKNGEWVSSMSLGEKVTWLGVTEVDSANNVKYHKVQLSDSTTGWASEYIVVLGAKPGAILKEATLYKRPDLLTSTDKKLEKMNIVAVKKEKDKWKKVIGEKKKKQGWIKKENVSEKNEDIAVAAIAKKALEIKDKKDKVKELKKIVDNTSLKKSSFMPDLKKKLDELTAKPEKEKAKSDTTANKKESKE